MAAAPQAAAGPQRCSRHADTFSNTFGVPSLCRRHHRRPETKSMALPPPLPHLRPHTTICTTSKPFGVPRPGSGARCPSLPKPPSPYSRSSKKPTCAPSTCSTALTTIATTPPAAAATAEVPPTRYYPPPPPSSTSWLMSTGNSGLSAALPLSRKPGSVSFSHAE